MKADLRLRLLELTPLILWDTELWVGDAGTVFPRILEHATIYVTRNSEHAPLEKSKIAKNGRQTKLLCFVHNGMRKAVKPKNRIKIL